MNSVRITELPASSDNRGFSFAMPPETLQFVRAVADVHASSIVLGAVRGNHCHVRKHRVILVLPGAAWSLHWDEGKATAVQCRAFDGSPAVLMLMPPGSHAVGNDGNTTLRVVACSATPCDAREVVERKVV
jgi:oxalate decarboxylase/phosphoglucose isomerase-like protein (cupin superfamily)